MTEHKHTPGPWVKETHHKQGYNRLVPVWYVSTENGAGIAMQPAYSNPDHEQANAHLISAAPDLLEALEEARQSIVDGFRAILGNMPEDKMAGIKKIDAAIAKAKGEWG